VTQDEANRAADTGRTLIKWVALGAIAWMLWKAYK
jgi:hypothetical protein